MAKLDGDPFLDGDLLSFEEMNRILQNFRGATIPSNLQSGSLFSDSDDEKLYHTHAATAKEILQADTPLGDDNQLIGGDGSDSILVPYEETINDAIIWGLPVDPKRGLILCDVSDIGGDLTVVPVSTHPQKAMVDLDLDSYIAFGWEADDKPMISVGGNSEGVIIPVCADDKTKTDNYNILVTDLGKTFIMNAIDKTFYLPSVDNSNVGGILTFVFISTGKLTIDAADADTIDDSGAGDGIYCEQNGEKYSTIKLMLVSTTEWVILGAKGIWITTT